MRKYIYKFKNYTSVEVDNIHDLKEGDLALYEDKFVTRNNGKVEEVVKGSGGSSEEEYSTDYPDDLYYKLSYSEDSPNIHLGESVFKDLSNPMDEIYIDISNIDVDSIKITQYIPSPLFDLGNQGKEIDVETLITVDIDDKENFSLSKPYLGIYNRRPILNKNNMVNYKDVALPLTITFLYIPNNIKYKVTFPHFCYGRESKKLESELMIYYTDTSPILKEKTLSAKELEKFR